MRCLRLLLMLLVAAAAYGAIGATQPFHRALSNKGEDLLANTTGRLAQKAVHTASDAASTVVDEIKRRAAHGHA